MFTGIVEELGTVVRLERRGDAGQLAVRASLVLEGTKVGDSIAVNGTCLTVTQLTSRQFSAELMRETLERTNLGRLRPGDTVNLERAARLGEPIGGHFVQGHVDGVGTIEALERGPGAVLVRVGIEQSLLCYLVPQGSVAIDGISLTVVDVYDDGFIVSLIPHTLQATTLGRRMTGDPVNIEVDILGKYVRNFLERASAAGSQVGRHGGIDEETLRKYGFLD